VHNVKVILFFLKKKILAKTIPNSDPKNDLIEGMKLLGNNKLETKLSDYSSIIKGITFCLCISY
jgi:hypothetical protein